MTLPAHRQHAGEALVVGFHGEILPPPLVPLAREGALGGVILFKRNLEGTLLDVARRVAGIVGEFRGAVAPLVSVDQEGGRVARLRTAPMLTLPPMRALAAREDVALIRRVARALGSQLRALGFTMDYAPVLDVDTNPANPVIGDRAFGADADTVIARALPFADGLHDAGVLSCAKHFPGHGDTDLDSHLALPRLRHDRARLDAVELAPFRACRGRIPALMTAHVIFDALAPGVPATLSRAVVTDVLRGELRYDGAVFSDDLEMKAVADHFPTAEAAVGAIEAGCDLLLVCSDVDRALAAHEALVHLAERDPRFAARLAEAAQRSRALRGRVPAPAPITEHDALAAALDTVEVREVAAALADSVHAR